MHITLNIYHPMAIFILHMGKLKHKDDAQQVQGHIVRMWEHQATFLQTDASGCCNYHYATYLPMRTLSAIYGGSIVIFLIASLNISMTPKGMTIKRRLLKG